MQAMTKGHYIMRQYETAVIVDAMISEDAIAAELKRVEETINEAGEIIKIDTWGKRKMAYDIRKKSHGFYAYFYYKGESSIIEELEKNFRINENVLRWMTLVDHPLPANYSDEVKEEVKEEAEA
jgi:small subunit ribosomal protein S6|tara:strand:- start:1391 stop:1762 length:372 start_codon:yes stop_codon:yes gene_type:complete